MVKKATQPSYRRLLTLGTSAILSAALLIGCTSGTPNESPTQDAGDGQPQSKVVFVRTSGGSYEDAIRENTWEPFTAETGIEVISVPANTAKILAMVESGSGGIDLILGSEGLQLQLQEAGALEKLDLSKLSNLNLDSIEPVRDYYIGMDAYAEVLTYNTDQYGDNPPKSWADVWDLDNFPGNRALQDATAIAPNLEFALLADGVGVDDIYPIDIDRAFESLEKVKNSVIKFFDTGALGAELFGTEQAVIGSLWNNRVIPLIKEGAPVAIEWNQAKLSIEGAGILEAAANKENAYKLLEFSLRPEIQAATFPPISLSPVNSEAFPLIPDDVASLLPTAPDNVEKGFYEDAEWWQENRQKVLERWQEFLVR